MTLYWHNKQGNKGLLLLFNGWGFDSNVVRSVHQPAFDVLLVSDYTQVDPELLACTQAYKQVYLLAWSFGVFVANYCGAAIRPINQCIAVNGTLFPVHNEYGISEDTFNATLQQYNERNRQKFMLRVSGGIRSYEAMAELLPERSTDSQLNELKALQALFKIPVYTQLDWNRALVSMEDKIFPPANMRAAWGSKAYEIRGAHYVDFNKVINEYLL